MKSSYYASPKLDPARHLLVRISVGSPRYCKHPVEQRVPLLYPDRATWGEEVAYMQMAYLNSLDKNASAIFEAVLALERDAALSDREVVVLCFESLKNPDRPHCHRRWFAAWWERRTGERVDEL